MYCELAPGMHMRPVYKLTKLAHPSIVLIQGVWTVDRSSLQVRDTVA